MKIVHLIAENIKKLRLVDIKPEGNMVLITGANGQGKSSVLDAFEMALAGAKSIPSQPIRQGEKKARVVLDMGEFTVTRTFTAAGGGTLTIQPADPAHAPFRSPQEMLDKMLGELTFDPLAFSRMKPKDQLETLRGLVTLGIDIDDLDKATEGAYADRTVLNREIKALRAKLPEVPEGAPEEEVGVGAIVYALAHGNKTNQERERLLNSIQTNQRMQAGAREEILRLQAAIKKQEEKIAAYDKQTLDETAQLPDAVDVAKLQQALTASDEQNKLARIVKEHKRIAAEIADKEYRVSNRDAAIQTNAELRLKTLAEAKFPVDGLAFGNGEILYNDVPFAQLATGEQIKISLAIAMEANPNIRIVRIKEGSLLDEGNLALIEMLAMEKDFQVWIEKVDTTGKMGIVIEDGAVASVNA